MKKIKFITLLLPLFFGCQEKEKQNIKSKIHNNMNNIIEIVLKKQLENGANQYIISAGVELPKEEFSNEELDVSVHFGKKILDSNGYKIISNKDFNNKIKTIFRRKLDSTTQNRYIYINQNNICDKTFIKYPNWEFQGFYIIKECNFISKFYFVPEIVNYQNEYSKIAEIENTISLTKKNNDEKVSIERWKDLENLSKKRYINQQRLISRNKYLFNDDKSQFPWLVTHDKFFMRSLVTDFGYTEDKKLLQWALENTHLPRFYTYAKKNDLEELGKLLWTKDCNGEIRVHQNTLDLLKEMSTPDENLYIMYVAEYLTNLEHLNANKELSDAQKAKIAAHLLYWGEQYKYDVLYDYNQMFMGHFWHYMDDGTYDKEFKKNNYYGLPKFKEWYEAAKKEKDLFLDDESIPDSPQPLDYEFKAEPIKQ
ncbi:MULTISPECIES: hypothetical protein [unclassified Apibacter]|uniref:hypothetical protein n=1 Tax=unclassified Apibacter TaxID=2630820 RepID=UPI00132BF2F5|nr:MULTISPECIES: hypothetical protein [unclassified Apibacter]MXO24354.1 hypothetical protein [Apibacter sp. B3924]MXO27544.1 hypothetical protein [Apibacter sp. B3813]MXO29499.1 hypothetical protein [Apibacter sp. B3913]MXO31451.1 hypothetical protein [Apibacter sp. B3912]MXP02888.1 hypothetical protein [Apibacter sp. B3918]